jgi:putative cell wall-binding protein
VKATQKSWVGRLAGVALLGALLGVVPGGLAVASSSATSTRVAGDDRYATAAAVAKAAYPTGADTVLVASGQAFPDALAGAALAARQTGPVLLTDPKTLSPATSTAIDDLKATKIVILGGTSSVSQDVETALAKKGTVTRIAGTDRYDTAAKIAAAIGSANIGTSSSRRTALIATGLNFADALAGGALSAAGNTGVLPVLLVNGEVPAPTKSALTDLGITQTIILGGTAAVSDAVATALQQITGNAPTRLAGSDRYATATAVATSELADFAFAKTGVVLANGVNFADALAGGPFAGKTKSPILLTNPTALSDATKTYLNGHSTDLTSITALGGTAAITDATLADAVAAAKGQAGPNGDINVTPQDTAFQPNDGSGTRTYTATGLTAQVDIALLPCSNVSAGSFKNADADNVADGSGEAGNAPDKASSTAKISSVNGAPNLDSNSAYANNASPASGTVTFVVGGPSSGTACVVPVVFVDADSNNALNTDKSNPATPSESFGVGGHTEFLPNAAPSGSFANVIVQSVNKDGHRFAACTNQTMTSCSSYFYDSGDTYKIDTAASTMAAFEAAISAGDTVSGTYTPGGVSTFSLADTSPMAPSIISVSESNTTTHAVTVTFGDSSTASVTSYKVYRATGGVVGGTGSVDCSGVTTGYAFLTPGTVADDGTATPLPPHSYTDTTPAANTAYCYKVSAVDNGDEGPLSTAMGVKTAA